MAGTAPPFITDLAPNLPLALERLAFPSYVIDTTGRIRWLNAAAKKIVGSVEGELFVTVVDPSDSARARAHFASDLRGDVHGQFALDVIGDDGERQRVEVCSAPLMSGDRAIGVFGIARPVEEPGARPKVDHRLTARQHEVVRQLAKGASTDEIAANLHITRETARNHIRHVLRRLGARSRLEAVAIAHRDGFV
jgi:DNA-binding CsgD family transcriptional regulator